MTQSVNMMSDYLIWDNVEPAVLTCYIDGTQSGQPVNIAIAKFGPLTKREMQSEILTLTGGETAVNLPVALLGGKKPLVGDRIVRTEESNAVYVIKGEPQLLHGGSRWRCVIVKGR